MYLLRSYLGRMTGTMTTTEWEVKESNEDFNLLLELWSTISCDSSRGSLKSLNLKHLEFDSEAFSQAVNEGSK